MDDGHMSQSPPIPLLSSETPFTGFLFISASNSRSAPHEKLSYWLCFTIPQGLLYSSFFYTYSCSTLGGTTIGIHVVPPLAARLTLKISSKLRRTACLAPSFSTVTMFCALFSPQSWSVDPASGRDLMVLLYHLKMTIILFPEFCIGPYNLHLPITFNY